MADLAAEIAAKLGLKTGEFKAALADANADVKSFGQDGAANAGQLTEAIHETHKAMRLFHQFMMAGGIVEALKKVFETAVKGAEESRDKTDENAAAVIRFEQTLKSMHSGTAEIAKDVVGGFNRVGESVGAATRYAIEFWEAQISGNRANIEAFDQAEAAGDRAAKMEHDYAVLKKEHGAEFKQINAEILALTREMKVAEEDLLPVHQRLNLLQEERGKIEDKIGSGLLTGIELRKQELELLRVEKVIFAAEREEQKQYIAEKEKENKADDEARLKALTNKQKMADLTEGIRLGETLIREEQDRGANTTFLEAQLEERKLLLKKAQGEEEAKALKDKTNIAGSIAEEIELLKIQHKVTLGLATGPEELRLRQIQLQRKEREADVQITDIAEQAITGKLLPADEKRLALLTKQKDELARALAIIQAIMGMPPTPAPAVDATLREVYALNEQWDHFAGKIQNKGDVRNLSDVQLTALVQRLEDQAGRQLLAGQQGNATYNSLYDPLYQSYRFNLAAARQEQSARRDFSQTVGAFGKNYAESSYDPSEFARLSQYLTADVTKQQASDINLIATTIKNVFPAQAAGIRG